MSCECLSFDKLGRRCSDWLRQPVAELPLLPPERERERRAVVDPDGAVGRGAEQRQEGQPRAEEEGVQR
eukprot:scaffold4191_cov95-Isochrysis_galbana.AAC.2